MRRYEMMVILDPQLDERTVAPSLDQFPGVVKTRCGSLEKAEIWGKRRWAYEMDRRTEEVWAGGARYWLRAGLRGDGGAR